MLARMTSKEVTDWAGYERVSGPLGQERDDQLAAMTAFYVVSALGVKKARLDKLVPKWDRPRKMPWTQMRDLAVAIAKQFRD